MKTIKLKEPTSKECSSCAKVYDTEDHVEYAIWYPQMGGYAGKCVVVFHKPNSGCFDAYVWHAGDFPFTDNRDYDDDISPNVIHHCSPEQFVEFGQIVRQLMGPDVL